MDTWEIIQQIENLCLCLSNNFFIFFLNLTKEKKLKHILYPDSNYKNSVFVSNVAKDEQFISICELVVSLAHCDVQSAFFLVVARLYW